MFVQLNSCLLHLVPRIPCTAVLWQHIKSVWTVAEYDAQKNKEGEEIVVKLYGVCATVVVVTTAAVACQYVRMSRRRYYNCPPI